MESPQVFRVSVPDVAYWRRQMECQDACSVHTGARGYVKAITDGNPELAYIIAREPNPFASICGRVCAAPCEVALLQVVEGDARRAGTRR